MICPRHRRARCGGRRPRHPAPGTPHPAPRTRHGAPSTAVRPAAGCLPPSGRCEVPARFPRPARPIGTPACSDLFLQDGDALMLFDARLDGIEDPHGEVKQRLGRGDLRAAAWFEPSGHPPAGDPKRGFRHRRQFSWPLPVALRRTSGQHTSAACPTPRRQRRSILDQAFRGPHRPVDRRTRRRATPPVLPRGRGLPIRRRGTGASDDSPLRPTRRGPGRAVAHR